MNERALHHSLEKLFIAAEIGHVVALHAYNSRANLGGWIENARFYGEKVFHIIPSLKQHAQYAVVFLSRWRSETQSHFALNHSCTQRNIILIFEHVKEYLRTDVIGIISRKHETASVEKGVERDFQEIAFD